MRRAEVARRLELAVIDRDVCGSVKVDPGAISLIVVDTVDGDVRGAVKPYSYADVVCRRGIGVVTGYHCRIVNTHQPDGRIHRVGVVVAGGDSEDVEVRGDIAP